MKSFGIKFFEMPTYIGKGGTERWHRDPIEWPSKVPKGLTHGVIDVKPMRLNHLLKPPCEILLHKYESEKAEKLKELAQPETACREVSSEEDGPVVVRSDKRGRSPQPQELAYPPTKQRRRGPRPSSSSSNTLEDGKKKVCKVLLRELRYSQLSCKQYFRCGRPVSLLVDELLEQKVRLSASFLRLTVFQEYDKNNRPILRCIDNRRLFALRQYAEKSGQDDLMVHINLFNQETLMEVQRYIHNCDQTPGDDIKLRRGKRGKKNKRHE